jgi:hypothetical protein
MAERRKGGEAEGRRAGGVLSLKNLNLLFSEVLEKSHSR